MWDSTVCQREQIDEYRDILISQGYTSFFYYPDEQYPITRLREIDTYEIWKDTLFFFFNGHGTYHYDTQNSVFKPRAGSSITSAQLKIEMDKLEAQRKGFVVDACKSGGFVDDFAGYPYLAISAANYHLNGYHFWGRGGIFGHAFFDSVKYGGGGVDVFNYAVYWNNRGVYWYDGMSADWPLSSPQISNGLSYSFFD